MIFIICNCMSACGMLQTDGGMCFLMSDFGLNSVLNLMKERVSLSRIVRQDVVLQKKGREFVGHCPFHNEKTGSFFVNDDKGTFYCFGCGASGDIVEYLMRKRGIQFMQAVEILSEMSGIKIPEKAEYHADTFQNQQNILQKVMEFFKDSLKLSGDATTYCKKRGITRDLIDRFSIGYAPKDMYTLLNFLKNAKFSYEDILNSGVFVEKDGKLIVRFRDRLMFPVFNKKGFTIAFGGRSIHKDVMPKYINSPETAVFQKRETLYNYNIAVRNISKTVPFILVEGYMDVVMMNKYGFSTAVASMGTAFSPHHLAKLWRYSDCPIICLDGDSAGYNAMVKIAFLSFPYLQPGKSLKFAKIPGDDDPDSFLKNHPKSEMDDLIAKSRNLIDFVWEHFSKTLNNMNSKTPENVAEWKREIFNHIDEIQNIDIKSLYKQDIKKRIFNLLGRNNVSNTYKNKQTSPLLLRIDRNEKTLLHEAALLYILILRPSVIPIVVEELATVEFSDKNFERLRHCMVECLVVPDTPSFEDVKRELERIAGRFCNCAEMPEAGVVELWRDVFNSSIARERVAEDVKIAKNECSTQFDDANWNRFKALKLNFFNADKIKN